MGKTGLIVEGGGMKCAYSCGILDRFLDEGIEFPYTIGVSAGTANLASYLARQRGRSAKFYLEHIKAPDYFGYESYKKTKNAFNLDYIYRELSNSDGRNPLDFDTLKNNPSEFVIVATEANTGSPHYFTKDDLKQDDYSPIMASSCLPAICRPIFIDNEPYYDGGISDPIPVQKAIDDGCDKLVILLSKPRDFIKKREKYRMVYSFLCREYPYTVSALNRRHIRYGACQTHAFTLEKHGKAFIFAPSDPPKMSTYNMDIEVERKLYEMGLNDFDKYKNELKDFLYKNNPA